MPKSLLERWRPECVREFRAAARLRWNDGLSLATHGRRTGAIYLWGYSAEMSLKAAYFSLTFAETAPITWSDLKHAIKQGQTIHSIAWPAAGAGHSVRAWAELLVAERAATPGKAFAPADGREVQACGQRIGRLWSETLR